MALDKSISESLLASMGIVRQRMLPRRPLPEPGLPSLPLPGHCLLMAAPESLARNVLGRKELPSRRLSTFPRGSLQAKTGPHEEQRDGPLPYIPENCEGPSQPQHRAWLRSYCKYVIVRSYCKYVIVTLFSCPILLPSLPYRCYSLGVLPKYPPEH